jgi:Amt family ammonium transporter
VQAITRIIGGKTDIIMMLNGALAGLVSITAEPLMPSPLAAICIGAIGGSYYVLRYKLLKLYEVR